MYKITIEGQTLQELARNIMLMAQQFQTTAIDDQPAPKATRKKQPTNMAELKAQVEEPIDAELEAELNEPVEEMPATGKTVVDAGTGKPAPETAGGKIIQMTFDDVKKAAAKLVAKDATKLASILDGYGAKMLSEVPKAKLADFAGEVMEALD